MFEGINKYTLELAIDQQKVAQNKTEEVQISFDGKDYKYGSHIFGSREQAIYWIGKQDIHLGWIHKQIREEQLQYAKKGQKSSLEDLFQVFIEYYTQTRKIQKQTLEKLNSEQKNIIGKLSQDSEHLTMEFPLYNIANIITLGTSEFKPFLPNERILPIPNPGLEEHGYSMEEFGDFVQKSLLSLSGQPISKEIAKDIARRIVIIELVTDEGYYARGTGFIINGRVVTNDHVIRGENTLRVLDLTGKEFQSLTYKIPKDYDDTWDKDVAYIDSTDFKDYVGYPELGLASGYIFGVKSTHKSILPDKKGAIPISLWISKVELSDCNDDHGKNQGEFTYKNSSGGINGTSGSIVYNDGKPVGVHGFGDQRYLKKEMNVGYGIFATPESYIKETGKNSSGGDYFDLPKNKQ